jgi:hypothetical protein
MEVKLLLAGSGTGKGIVVNNKSKHETFMKMLQVQAGLGIGVQKFSVVLSLRTRRRSTASLIPDGNLADKPRPQPKQQKRAGRSVER